MDTANCNASPVTGLAVSTPPEFDADRSGRRSLNLDRTKRRISWCKTIGASIATAVMLVLGGTAAHMITMKLLVLIAMVAMRREMLFYKPRHKPRFATTVINCNAVRL